MTLPSLALDSGFPAGMTGFDSEASFHIAESRLPDDSPKSLSSFKSMVEAIGSLSGLWPVGK